MDEMDEMEKNWYYIVLSTLSHHISRTANGPGTKCQQQPSIDQYQPSDSNPSSQVLNAH